MILRLARKLITSYKKTDCLQKPFNQWQEFIACIQIGNEKPLVYLSKENDELKCYKLSSDKAGIDVTLIFKNPESTLLFLTRKATIRDILAEHRLVIQGDKTLAFFLLRYIDKFINSFNLKINKADLLDASISIEKEGPSIDFL